MKKILFPTDFSSASLNAFAYALHLAKKINAEIITLHVYELPSLVYTDEASFMKQHYNMSDLDEFENFKSEVPKLRLIAERENRTDITISNMLERGNPEDHITAIADREGIDYIVIGTTGASGLKEVFFGSVAQKVISKSKTAVLAIPASCEFREFKRILFLTDFDNKHLEPLKKVYLLSELFHAYVDVMEIKRHHENNENTAIEEWKKKFPHSGFSYYIFTSDDYEQTVLDIVENHKTDLIAIPIRHKTILEKIFAPSLSKKLAFHSTVPILSLHYID